VIDAEETNLLQPTSRFQLLKDILGLYPAIDGEKHKSTVRPPNRESIDL
jgi:hypothetical protein